MHLVIARPPKRPIAVHPVAGTVKLELQISAGRAVGHGGMRHAKLVRGATEPTPAQGAGDDVMMGLSAAPAVFLADEQVPMPVRVGRERKRVRPRFEQAIKRLAIRRLRSPVERETPLQRDVHQQHHQLVARHTFEVAGYELKLAFAQHPAVIAGRLRPLGIGPEPLDVVQHQEMNRAMVERIVGRTVDLPKRLVGIPVVRGIEIQIVIAQHIVPRHSDQTQGRVQRLEGRQIVKRDIAQTYPKCRLGTDQLRHHGLGQVAHLAVITRLRIAAEQRFEPVRFLPRAQRKIDRLRKRSGGWDTGKPLPRRSRRLVVVVEPRQILVILSGHPATWFDDKKCRRLPLDRQGPVP